jgi:hypothetical protein
MMCVSIESSRHLVIASSMGHSIIELNQWLNDEPMIRWFDVPINAQIIDHRCSNSGY